MILLRSALRGAVSGAVRELCEVYHLSENYLADVKDIEANEAGLEEGIRWLNENATVIHPMREDGCLVADIVNEEWIEIPEGMMLETTGTRLMCYPWVVKEEPLVEDLDNRPEASLYSTAYKVFMFVRTSKRLFLDELAVLEGVGPKLYAMFERNRKSCVEESYLALSSESAYTPTPSISMPECER